MESSCSVVSALKPNLDLIFNPSSYSRDEFPNRFFNPVELVGLDNVEYWAILTLSPTIAAFLCNFVVLEISLFIEL